ncbi:MAG: hypothetical protein PHR61_03410 [Candidatus Absconditabacteria bacterium]|nr:hypothetical protein [Candidatus Absconditabacteria bacterium]
MKNKNLILFGIVVWGLSIFVSQSNAQEIGFSYISGQNFGPGCPVVVDVFVDAMGKNVSTTDVILESSMKYLDFIPNTSLFPYFFPPVVRTNGLVHIVGFSVFPEQVITGSGSIGTLYFEANPTDMDASIKIYFLGDGITTDSNLSYGGVDQLQKVGQANFVIDQEACIHAAAVISGGFAGTSYEDGLSATINKINEDYKQSKILTFIWSYGILILVLLLIFVLAIIYRKKILLVLNKRTVGEKLVS